MRLLKIFLMNLELIMGQTYWVTLSSFPCSAIPDILSIIRNIFHSAIPFTPPQSRFPVLNIIMYKLYILLSLLKSLFIQKGYAIRIYVSFKDGTATAISIR